MNKTTAQDLLLYWSPKTAKDVLKREDILDHVASDQLKRASIGDVIWVVTVYDGELFLLGKLIVDTITDRTGAMKRLGRKDVWGNKNHYGVAIRGKEEPLKKISLRNEIRKLVFISSNVKSNRLNIDDKGNVNAQQLQTMRILDNASAHLLDQIWKGK
ncbi:hypothetical protein ACFLYF_03145 [Chloroflexota bacterium]